MTDDEFDELIERLWDKHSNAEEVMDTFSFYEAALKIRALLTDPTP